MPGSAAGAAIVVGAGARRGLGGALAHRLAREGLAVFVAARTAERVEALAEELRGEGGDATGVACDTTRETDVRELFERAAETGRPLELVCFNAGNNQWGSLLEMEAETFEQMWRVGCLGGFLVGREAGRRMRDQGRGTLLFTGASASLRGKAAFGAFAAAKAGLRMVAQSLARELGPAGVHVAHVVIDGVVRGDMIRSRMPEIEERLGAEGMLEPDAVAESFWQLHRQHPSAWTQELDLRPFKESF